MDLKKRLLDDNFDSHVFIDINRSCCYFGYLMTNCCNWWQCYNIQKRVSENVERIVVITHLDTFNPYK